MRASSADSAATALAYPEPSSGERCLDGLTVSADGTRLSSSCAAATGGVWTLPALDALRAIPPDPARSGAGALDSTGARLAEARASGLVVLDAVSLAVLQTVASVSASAPDWSPDGRALVFVRNEPAASPTPTPMMMPMPPSEPMAGRDKTSIVRVEQLDDGSWSVPLSVVTASAETGAVLRTPRFSPDGSWIAFAAGEERTDDVADQRLFVVRAHGGVPLPVGPVAPASPMMMADKRGSGSLPGWLPADRPDRAWLVFSSTREPGREKPAPMLRQLWVSAVDLLPEEPGIDVSRPAFRLPAQAVASDNRRAAFARTMP